MSDSEEEVPEQEEEEEEEDEDEEEGHRVPTNNVSNRYDDDDEEEEEVEDLEEMEDDRDPEQDHENELDMCDIPAELKGLRACKRCCLIKTFVQFVEQGCENCPFLHMEEHSERVHECTSSYFTGMITLIEPKGSWVAKWQRISKGKPGIYAVEVIGDLSAADIEKLTDMKIPVRCRPGA